jgi:hypothetical protein
MIGLGDDTGGVTQDSSSPNSVTSLIIAAAIFYVFTVFEEGSKHSKPLKGKKSSRYESDDFE